MIKPLHKLIFMAQQQAHIASHQLAVICSGHRDKDRIDGGHVGAPQGVRPVHSTRLRHNRAAMGSVALASWAI